MIGSPKKKKKCIQHSAFVISLCLLQYFARILISSAHASLDELIPGVWLVVAPFFVIVLFTHGEVKTGFPGKEGFCSVF